MKTKLQSMLAAAPASGFVLTAGACRSPVETATEGNLPPGLMIDCGTQSFSAESAYVGDKSPQISPSHQR